MATKFARGKFAMKHPEKYVGTKVPTYRSSWEWTFMNFCDNNKSVQKWASEAVQIPYRDPLTNRQTVYVPDFLIVYVDKTGKKHAEIVEIKPSNQTVLEQVGKNFGRQMQYVKNMAKWEAARAYAKQMNINFRIINENDLFHQGKKR